MGWGFLIQLAVTGGLLAYQYYTREKPEKPVRPNINDVSLPRAEQGVTVPFFFGQVRITSPHVLWFGDFEALDVQNPDDHSQILGYSYKFSADFCLGIPMGSDATPDVRLTRMWSEERVIFEGSVNNWLDLFFTQPLVEDSGINNGGGWLAFYPGWGRTAASPHPADPVHVQNFDASASYDSTLLPAYRGFTRVAFREYLWGPSPTPPGISFETRITDDVLGFGAITDTDNPGYVDANPAEVLYIVLTHHYLSNIPTASLDSTSFTAAATTLASEGFGISGVLYNADNGEKLANEILRYIDGVLYRDHTDNKVYLTLVRDDYTPAALSVYDESVLTDDSEITFEKSTWEDLPNTITLTYNDRAGFYNTRVVGIQDMAGVLRQGSRKRMVTVNYPWITRRSLAKRVAQRDLSAMSRPLARISITADRSTVTVRPGDVFKFSSAKYGISQMILRVTDIDFGTLDKDPVTIQCIEDKFAINHDVADPGPVVWPSAPGATAMTIAKVIEAPRWLNSFRHPVVEAGRPHLLYLGVKPASSFNDSFNGRVSDDAGVTYETDITNVKFTSTGTLETALGITNEYETTTTVRLENQSPATLSLPTADETGIRNYGGNLWLIDNPDGAEIIANESSVLDTGVEVFSNIWRGLLDTVQRVHPVGTRCYQIHPGMLKVGLTAQGATEDLKVKLLTRNLWGTLPEEDVVAIDISMVNRAVKPHPVDSPRMSNWAAASYSNNPGAVTQDEQAVGFYRRRHDLTTIYRGTDSDDAEGDAILNTLYDIDARIVGDGAYTAPGTWNQLLADDGGAAASTTVQPVVLSDAIGHGDAEIRFVAKHNLLGSLVVENYQSAFIPFHAHRFRQLLPDPSFELSPAGRWTTLSGTPGEGDGDFGDGGLAIGGDGTVSSTNTWSVSRIVDLSEYTNLRGLVAYLDWCDKEFSGSSVDESRVTIYALNSSDISQGTVTNGWQSPNGTYWNDRSLTYELPDTTTKIQILVETRTIAVHDGSDVLLDNFTLRVGQLDGADQQLLNPNWDSGTTNWTPVSGTWAVDSGAELTGSQSLKQTVDAAGEIYQEVNLSAGYKQRATIFLEGWTTSAESLGDTTEIKVEAKTSGGTTLATATTGAFETAVGIWTRFELLLDLPDGTETDKYRVTIYTSGEVANTRWDRFRGFTFKELHPVAQDVDVQFPNALVQTFPRTAAEWARFNSGTCPLPSAIWRLEETSGNFNSSMEHAVPTQHALIPSGTIIYDQEFAGVYDGLSYTGKKCVEFPFEYSSGAEFPTTAELSVDGTNSWALLVACRFFGKTGNDNALAGSLSGSPAQGWLAYWRAGAGNGRLDFWVAGDTSVTVQLNTVNYGTGAPTYFVVKYNATTGKMSAWSPHQSAAEVSVPVNAGNLAPVRVGGGPISNSPDIQIACVVRWDGAAAEALVQADTNDWWMHGRDPSGEISSYTLGGEIIAPVSTDASGIILSGYAGTDVALVYDPLLTNSRGLSMHLTQTNIVPDPDPLITASWIEVGTFTTKTLRYGVDAMRMNRSVRLVGDNAMWYTTTSIAAPGAGDYTVRFAAKSTGAAHNMRVRITTGADVLVAVDTITLTPTWVMYEVTLDGSTLGGSDLRVGFAASDTASDQDIELSTPISIVKDASAGYGRFVTAMHDGVVSAATCYLDQTLDVAYNEEGELRVDGLFSNPTPVSYVLADVRNASNSNNRRIIQTTAAGAAQLRHWDQVAAVQSLVSGGTIDWRTSEFCVRGRWNRGSLMESNVSPLNTLVVIAPDGATNYNTKVFSGTSEASTIIQVGAFGGIASRILLSSREKPV